MTDGNREDDFDLDRILHPTRAFRHPSEVVNAPDLSLNEKRAIFASWASDACAVEATPALRQPSQGLPVLFDDVMDALKSLDAEAAKGTDYARLISRAQRIKGLYDKEGGGGIFFC